MKNIKSQYPLVSDETMLGVYPAHVKSGAGYVYADVLEYRVWCHPEQGAPDEAEGDDYYHFFVSYEEALDFSTKTIGAEPPLVLIRQTYWIAEPQPQQYLAITGERLTEWQPHWLDSDNQVHTENELWDYYKKQGWPLPTDIEENLYATPLIPDFDAAAYGKFPNYLGVSCCQCVAEEEKPAHYVAHIGGYWYILCNENAHQLDYEDISEQEEIIIVAIAELLQHQPDLAQWYNLEDEHYVVRLDNQQPWQKSSYLIADIRPDSPYRH